MYVITSQYWTDNGLHFDSKHNNFIYFIVFFDFHKRQLIKYLKKTHSYILNNIFIT